MVVRLRKKDKSPGATYAGVSRIDQIQNAKDHGLCALRLYLGDAKDNVYTDIFVNEYSNISIEEEDDDITRYKERYAYVPNM